MLEAAQSPTIVRFGAFEVDLRAGEVRKQGLKVKLQERPFQILTFLLENRGEVVTREELRKRLWPADTFVDFDHSVNTAINKLRDALGDSAENPRFIETLPRHGYRFIVPVDYGATGRDHLKVRDLAERHKGRRWLAAVAIFVVAIILLFETLVALNIAGLRDWLLGPPAHPKIESIAVLPFENLSGDPNQEYFADGMTEELITDLGKISALLVISRTSVMRYKGTKKTVPEIARELKVDAIVEAAVVPSSDRVHVTAKLIRTNPERQLWTQTYECNVGDVMVLQSEVARAIARQIRITLTPQENAQLGPTRPVHPEVHRFYLLGRFYWNKRTEQGFKKAIDLFQRALEIDPVYAPAYAGVADSYNLLGDYAYLRPQDAFPKAKAAALKALQIDEGSAEAHTSLAMACWEYDWDWPACEKEYKRAIQLNPNYGTAHHWYSEYLSSMRRHAEAVAEARRARELDPLSPAISLNLAHRYWFMRQYDREIRGLQETVSLFPQFANAYGTLAYGYMAIGRYQEAIGALQKERSLSGATPDEVAELGEAYAKGGIRGFKLWHLWKLREESKHRYVRAVYFAYLFAALGEKDQAFSYLEKAYEERDWHLARLQVDPWLDPLRSDPRFQEILRRMNFPP